MLGPPLLPLLMTFCWGALQGAPIDGTWELARIFRSGPTAASHPVPIDSTVYLRLTLKTMPGRATRFPMTVSRVTPFLLTSFAVCCSGDRSRSPTCGLALLVGPRMIQQQLTILPFVLTDAPRGLSASLPALVAGTSHQGEVTVAYEGPRLALTYQGPSFPPFPTDSAVYGVLVVDDSTPRAPGGLVYQSLRRPA